MKATTQKVAILGAGNWGTVLSLLASKNNAEVLLYDHDAKRAAEIVRTRENSAYLPGHKLPSNVLVTSDLEQTFKESKLIVPVIPSKYFRELVRSFASFVEGDHFIVHGIKGLEPKTHLRMSQILLEETACLRVGVLSGPNLANELAEGQIGASVVASRFEEVIEAMQEAFASDQFRIYGNHDLVGVEWSGALKNILAISCGIISELKLGFNTQAMLLTRGLSEISKLLSRLGADSATLTGLAGIGDIIATCSSPMSRNFRAGQLLVQGVSAQKIPEQLKMTAEGLNTIGVAKEIAEQFKLELPIIEALYQVIYQNQNLNQTIRALMGRPQKFESL